MNSMGTVHQIRAEKAKQDDIRATIEQSEPLENLYTMIQYAEVHNGYIDAEDVLILATVAREAINSIWADLEQANRDALQDAILETLLDKDNV